MSDVELRVCKGSCERTQHTQYEHALRMVLADPLLEGQFFEDILADVVREACFDRTTHCLLVLRHARGRADCCLHQNVSTAPTQWVKPYIRRHHGPVRVRCPCAWCEASRLVLQGRLQRARELVVPVILREVDHRLLRSGC